MTMDKTEMNDLNVIHADSLVCIHDHGEPRKGRAQAELDLVKDGAVAIRNGRILCAGPTGQVLRQTGDDVPTMDARGCTVLPGLIETHSHPVFAGNRHHEYEMRLKGLSGQEIRKAGGGIWSTVVNTRQAPDHVLLENTLAGFRAILAGGASTLEAKSGYGLTTDQELRLLNILNQAARQTPLDIVITFLGAHIAPQDGPTPGAYIAAVRDEMLPRVMEQGLARFHDITCETGDFTAPQAAELLAVSKRAGMPTRVHADASSHSFGWRTAVEGSAVSADHLTYTPDSEIKDLGPCHTIATLLPLAEQFYLDNRRANGRLFIETGVPVALATDYCSSFQATSILLTIAAGCSWFKFTPAEAITGTTLNAAYALGRQKDKGSLDPGKHGDLTILNCSHPNEVGTRIGAPLVRQVISRGRVIFRGLLSGPAGDFRGNGF